MTLKSITLSQLTHYVFRALASLAHILDILSLIDSSITLTIHLNNNIFNHKHVMGAVVGNNLVYNCIIC